MLWSMKIADFPARLIELLALTLSDYEVRVLNARTRNPRQKLGRL